MFKRSLVAVAATFAALGLLAAPAAADHFVADGVEAKNIWANRNIWASDAGAGDFSANRNIWASDIGAGDFSASKNIWA